MQPDNTILFNYEDFLIRVVTLDNGEPGFVAKDIAKVLEHSNPTEMVRGLDDDEYLKRTVLQGGQNRAIIILTEPGLRKLLSKSRSSHSKKLALKLGFTEMIFPVKEQANLEIIIRAVSGIIFFYTFYIKIYKYI